MESLSGLKYLITLEALERLVANNLLLETPLQKHMAQAWHKSLPLLKGVRFLSLTGNKIIWLPYKNSFTSSFSSTDVEQNNKKFSEYFPSLEMLWFEEGKELKGSSEQPIQLSSLDRFLK